MATLGKCLVGLSILLFLIIFSICVPKFRQKCLNILLEIIPIIAILAIIAIFFNNFFMLMYANTTKIGLWILCLGIIGIGTKSGIKLIITGGIIALIGYFILPLLPF